MKFVFIAAGLGLWMWIHKRRFDRTNSSGVQEFQNFWHLHANCENGWASAQVGLVS